jgi:hypothetical protein
VPASHALFGYSVTVEVGDKAVLGALRGLSFEVETDRYPQVSSGGTTGDAWANDANRVTFRFTSAELCLSFLAEAKRILRAGLWRPISTDDNDPATPRNRGPRP